MIRRGRGRGGGGPAFGSGMGGDEEKVPSQSQNANGVPFGGTSTPRGRGGGLTGGFGSSNKTVTFGNSVNINEDHQAQPTQKTDSTDGSTMPRGGISGRGRGRGGNGSNAFSNNSSDRNNEQPAGAGQQMTGGFGRGGGRGGRGGSNPNTDANSIDTGNDFGNTNPPMMTGRGRGGGRGGRGGLGPNNDTNNSSSNVNNDNNTSSNGGYRGGRGGGRGGSRSISGESNIDTNATNQTQSSAPSRGGRGGGRGGFGTGANSTEVNTVAAGARGGRSFFSSFNDPNPRANRDETSQQQSANRPPSTRHVPVIRPVNEIFQEDIDHQDLYMEVLAEDEDVIMTGGAVDGVAKIFDNWTELQMDPRLYENVVNRCKYYRPRKIQSHVIPTALEGKDMKVLSETGSGKTTAFMIPIIQKILEMPEADRSPAPPFSVAKPLALIIVPTRELCVQVFEYGLKFVNEMPIKVCKAYGEYSIGHNIAEIRRGCDILCATPGRLQHLIRENIVNFTKLKFFIIDEADHMLENDFLDTIYEIVAVPGFPPREERQTMLFSATFPQGVQDIAQKILRQEYYFAKHNKPTVAANCRIEQRFVEVETKDKTEFLKKMLEKEVEDAQKIDPANPKIMRTLVFVETRRDADRLALFLTESGLKACTVNADRTQAEREESLVKFRNGDVNVLVATDVCARGIDIKDCEHVINFDIPNEDRVYVHRIGRTGRLKHGRSTTFIDMKKDGQFIPALVKLVIDAEQQVPPFMAPPSTAIESRPKESDVANEVQETW